MGGYQPAIKLLTKHLLAFGKLFRRIQQLSRERFAALPTCGDLVLFYWSEVVAAANVSSQMIAGTSVSITCEITLTHGSRL